MCVFHNFSCIRRFHFDRGITECLSLKESAKSTKTTGKLWIKEFCCVRVHVERLARLQVNVHVHLSCMFTTALRYCLVFWLDEELVSVVEGKT